MNNRDKVITGKQIRIIYELIATEGIKIAKFLEYLKEAFDVSDPFYIKEKDFQLIIDWLKCWSKEDIGARHDI